ncbi:uncharacterized protein G6M90_00g047860 [Metarhizium brunneum]|uniref:Xylanolytic transcriptional activator regulatory domain-containing protein n=1 Tax=Metarhizium brunneum TaxID=500148 RepID=A0A7D5Z1F4_9HYPO|nr:hypothetical protein G6M90_00g047860 [Metarhizium brunneum]
MSGSPPCRRCVEQQLECVLAKSRRGGRRIKGVRNSAVQPPPPPRRDSDLGPSSNPRGPASSTHDDDDDDESDYHSTQGSQARPAQPPAGTDAVQGWPSSPPHAGNWRADSPDAGSTQEMADSRTSSDGLEGHIATTDLLNPSDALDLLAQVADLDPGRQRNTLTGQPGQSNRHVDGMQQTVGRPATSYYPPLHDGILTPSDASYLVKKYHEKFHPFFPVAFADIFEEGPITEWAEKEPHLLTAILTVASKDDPSWFRVYDACSRHIESFMSTLIYAGSNSVGSVEALLILAEWAPQRPQENSAIGCGQEDHGAWMLVGLAIRLGYLQRLEQTALLPDDKKPSLEVSRKRVAWAACYMSDRQVSIRLGKGFWSRGPGPSLHLRAADFPTLHAQALGPDNMGLLFQAHLELTQLISNAHDILYSSTSHRKQLYVGGEYVRYIDDFAQMVRKWKLTWANHSFTPPVKASLVLSFEFLRLYINAFAFQANLNRAAARNAQVGPGKASGPLFSNIAGKPDARFIYESIDAANSLLSILNSFIDPVAGLKCMPLKYCLYVIYAAVFLFKARLAGAISSEGDRGVRRAIHGTITQLQKTSNNPQSLGRRYATSLRLLWRKSSAKPSTKGATRSDPVSEPPELSMSQLEGQENIVPSATSKSAMDMDPLSGFSWRDLDSLGQFIANNTTMNMTDGILAGTDFDWEHSSGGLDDLAMRPQFDTMWAGHDIIF